MTAVGIGLIAALGLWAAFSESNPSVRASAARGQDEPAAQVGGAGQDTAAPGASWAPAGAGGPAGEQVGSGVVAPEVGGPGPLNLPGGKPSRSESCPNLDSRLVQLSESANPQAFAAEAGLDYDGGLIRIVMQLAEEAAPPEGYDLKVEATYADLVQAWAPISQLCALSAEPSVAFVRPPARPSLAAPQRFSGSWDGTPS